MPEGKTPEGFTNEEIERRAAVFKRFRELLYEQYDKLQNYLLVLDNQKKSIENLNGAGISAQIELEEKLCSDIFSIQKCIGPMRALFNEVCANKSPPDARISQNSPNAPAWNIEENDHVSNHITEEAGQIKEIEELEAALDKLKARASEQTKENLALIEGRTNSLRDEIKALRNNPFLKKQNPVFSGERPSFIDIRG